MVDVLTPEQRSRCMAAIKGKGSKPEMIVRSLIHRMGYRFRLHKRDLPGKPDLVFPGRQKIIFVHGCFWHRHDCKKGRPQPDDPTGTWGRKLSGNVERDKRNLRKLRNDGWNVLVIWECQLKDQISLIGRISSFLGPISSSRKVNNTRHDIA